MLKSRNLLLFIGLCGLTNGLPSVTPDPCSGATCGIGAQCEKVAHLIVCVCPDDTIGDPFVECKGTPGDKTTTTEMTTSTNTTPDPAPVTPTPSDYTTTSSFAPSTSTTTNTPSTSTAKYVQVASVTNFENLYTGSITGRNEDIPLAQFASAPPTLSHYAHSQTHAANSPMAVTFVTKETEAPSTYFQQLTELYSGSGSRTRTRPHSKPQPQQVHEHDNRNNHHNHDHDHSSNHGNNVNTQSHHSTNFDLSQPQQQHHSYYPVTGPSFSNNNYHNGNSGNFPNPSSRVEDDQGQDQYNSYYKDPSGKYEDCRTINNVIVCAEIEDHSKTGSDRNSVQQNQNSPFMAVTTQSKKMSRPRPMSIPTMRPAKPIYEDSSSLEVGSEPGFNNYRLDGPYGHPPMIQADYNTHTTSSIFKIPSNPQPGTPEAELCGKFCGIDSVCRIMLGRPICGCPEGHTGDPAVRCIPIKNSKHDKNSCVRHIDCHSSKVCIESQCVDPCSAENDTTRLCGMNAKCTVIHHTPLCACQDGYDGNPYVGCVI